VGMIRISILFFLLLFSCINKKQEPNFRLKLLDLIVKESNGFKIEFPDLYDSIAIDIGTGKLESSIIVKDLRLKGFNLLTCSRGNYPPLGPRIISFEMRKSNCNCIVNKIYYSTISENSFRISESIECIMKN
jgi:hypothetical protein